MILQRGKFGSGPFILHCNTAVSKAYCLYTDSKDPYRNGTDSALVVDIVDSTGAATYHHIGCTAQPSFTITHFLLSNQGSITRNTHDTRTVCDW